MTASTPSQRTLTFCLAGGGSGGHVTPALAIAESLRSQTPMCEVQLAVSERAIDATILSDTPLPWTPLPARGLRKSPMGIAAFLRGTLRAKARARRLLRDANVDAVGLLGGYVAAPVMMAAHAEGIPTLMLNLDAVPGRANRWMASRATALATAIETVRPLATTTRNCQVLDGPPIRANAQPHEGVSKADHRRLLDLDPDTRLLLVTGASQGAGTINDLMEHLTTTAPGLLDNWQVLHLAGGGNGEDLKTAYKRAGIKARVEPFRHAMGVAWGAADLVIARAGASTVGEARCAGVPAVYLPYPWHTDGHQWCNAQPSVDAGIACSIDDGIRPSTTWNAFQQAIEPLLQGSDLQAWANRGEQYKGLHGGPAAARMLRELALGRNDLAGASPDAG